MSKLQCPPSYERNLLVTMDGLVECADGNLAKQESWCGLAIDRVRQPTD
jgi:hypothetical protein